MIIIFNRLLSSHNCILSIQKSVFEKIIWKSQNLNPDNWMATFSWKCSNWVLTASRQPNFELLYRRMISCSVAQTTKYSCFRRSSLPSKKLSFGYSTFSRVTIKIQERKNQLINIFRLHRCSRKGLKWRIWTQKS